LILDQDPIAPSESLFKQLGWMSIVLEDVTRAIGDTLTK
jgi:hypothetical protein